MNAINEAKIQNNTMCLKLRKLRKEYNLSQAQIARILNINQPIISTTELCKTLPTIDQALTVYYLFCPSKSLSQFLDNEWLEAILHTRFKPLNPTNYYFKNVESLKKTILKTCKQYPNKAFTLEEIIVLNKHTFGANIFLPLTEVNPHRIKTLTRYNQKLN